jgi:hypothetical protein
MPWRVKPRHPEGPRGIPRMGSPWIPPERLGGGIQAKRFLALRPSIGRGTREPSGEDAHALSGSPCLNVPSGEGLLFELCDSHGLSRIQVFAGITGQRSPGRLQKSLVARNHPGPLSAW